MEEEEVYIPEGQEFEYEEGGIQEEEPVFGVDYKQLQYVSAFHQTSRVGRTPEETAQQQIGIILDSTIYDNISESEKEKIKVTLLEIPRIHLFNLNTLVLAQIWKNNKQPLKKETFNSFYNTYSLTKVNPVDLLRYIRFLSKVKV